MEKFRLLFCKVGKECTEQLFPASPKNHASQHTSYIYFGSLLMILFNILVNE